MTAPVNGYCTLADLKSPQVLNLTVSTYDQLLCDIITGVSRAIDNTLSRHFYSSTASETRYYTPKQETSLYIGDTVSVSAVATDTLDGKRTYPYTWATTDYDLWPFDAPTTGEPYRFIDVTPNGNYTFPLKLAKGVSVTGIFGWAAVPPPIAEACLLQSAVVYKRFQTPLGVSAMSALGQQIVRVPGIDLMYISLIGSYRMPPV